MFANVEQQRAYKHKVRWSETNRDMQKGSDRYIENILNRAIQSEKDEAERERKLEEFNKQPKRGAAKKEEELPEKTPRDFKTQKTKIAFGSKQNSQSHLLESSVSFSMANKVQRNGNKDIDGGAKSAIVNPNDSIISAGVGILGINALKTSLFSRVSPQKGGFAGSQSLTKKTMASTNGANTSVPATSSGFGGVKASVTSVTSTVKNKSFMSPFREAITKGVLSGTGMLTQ